MYRIRADAVSKFLLRVRTAFSSTLAAFDHYDAFCNTKFHDHNRQYVPDTVVDRCPVRTFQRIYEASEPAKMPTTNGATRSLLLCVAQESVICFLLTLKAPANACDKQHKTIVLIADVQDSTSGKESDSKQIRSSVSDDRILDYSEWYSERILQSSVLDDWILDFQR